jgi:PAS domain S-box-containing protein
VHDDTRRPGRAPVTTPAGGISWRNPAPSEAERLARILEVVPGGIVQLGADGAILRVNEQAKRFLGMHWDAIARRYVSDYAGETFHEDGRPCLVEEYPASQCLATGRPAGPLTLGVRGADGELRWGIFSALPFPEPDGARVGALVTFVDITERRHAELRSRAHDRLLDTVRLVHGRDDLGAATATAFHEPLATLVELTRSQRGFLASVDPGDERADELRLHAHVDTARERSASMPCIPLDAECRGILRDGRLRVLDRPAPMAGFGPRALTTVALLPLTMAGKVVGLVGLADAPSYAHEALSELEPLLTACADLLAALEERRTRKDLEAQLAQAERLAGVGTLAAGMAHEINNPLAYVLLNLQAFARHEERLARELDALALRLASTGAGDAMLALVSSARDRLEQLTRNARDATEGAERVQRIVRDLMTFSRVTEEQQTVVDVNAAVEVALKMAEHEIKYRARLVRELGAVPAVHGHDGRLSQVFLNLLINAARAIEEGHAEANEIRVRSWHEGDEVCVEVADTGHGVKPEHLGRLFEPFFSTRAPGAGAGLGLSICHNVVRAHGGRIEVTSEVEVGTRFVVRLPVARSSVPPRGNEHEHGNEHANGNDRPRVLETRLRLVLIDDDPMVLRVLAQLLRRTHDVTCAEGYAAAVEHLSSDAPVDVVVCDMMMLDGTGADVHAWIAEHRPALASRVVFMTGGTFTPKARAFLSEIAAPHLTKPFSLHEIEDALRRALAG